MAKNKYISTPQLMWEHFLAYVKEVKYNPIKIKDWVGAQGKMVYREKERPLTMEGFELYLAENGIIESVDQYFSNFEGRYNDYLGICSRIRKAIREDQISGGMAGIYNPSITQRLNGLTEKIQEDGTKEITVKVKYERKGGIIDGIASGPEPGGEGGEEV